MVFGKAYFVGLGIILIFVGTMFGFTGGLVTGPCAQLESLPKAFEPPFNPCTIFRALPMIGSFMQGLGAVILVIAILVIIKTRPKPPRKCEKCRAVLPEASNFCPKCGAKVEPKGKES